MGRKLSVMLSILIASIWIVAIIPIVSGMLSTNFSIIVSIILLPLLAFFVVCAAKSKKQFYSVSKFKDVDERAKYSFKKQKNSLNKLHRCIIDVDKIEKRLEVQKSKLLANVNKLDKKSRPSFDPSREDLSRLNLELKNINLQQIRNLEEEINNIKIQKGKLTNTEQRLSSKIEAFKTKIEIIKAKYSSAEAEVQLRESITGLSEEMNLVTALRMADEKTERMQAKAQALNEMLESGVLTDYTAPDPLNTDIRHNIKGAEVERKENAD
jgi:phage shock protein A